MVHQAGNSHNKGMITRPLQRFFLQQFRRTTDDHSIVQQFFAGSHHEEDDTSTAKISNRTSKCNGVTIMKDHHHGRTSARRSNQQQRQTFRVDDAQSVYSAVSASAPVDIYGVIATMVRDAEHSSSPAPKSSRSVGHHSLPSSRSRSEMEMSYC